MKSEPTKSCTKCDRVLLLDAFPRAKRGKYGVASRCRACRSADHVANKERDAESHRRWAERNRDRLRDNWARWYAGNRGLAIERARAHYREHYPENKQRYVEACQRRRARIAGAAINDFTDTDWVELIAYFDGHCAYCGRRSGELAREHIVAIVSGGDHTRDNVVPACGECNSSKGTRSLVEWLIRRDGVRA